MKFTFDDTNYAQILRRKTLMEGKVENLEKTCHTQRIFHNKSNQTGNN